MGGSLVVEEAGIKSLLFADLHELLEHFFDFYDFVVYCGHHSKYFGLAYLQFPLVFKF